MRIAPLQPHAYVAAGHVLAVVGMKREAALVTGPRVIAVAGGGDPDGLAHKLEAALHRCRPRVVISIGLGGALSPDLAVGDWVVADGIACTDGGWSTNGQFQIVLVNLLSELASGQVLIGPIAASDVIVADASAKAALHAASGALAVDMESGVAAEFAATHGLPFAALRVISDAADRALPRAAQAGMSKDGGLDILAVFWELAKDPRQLPALIRTGREAEVAFRRLKLLGRDNLLGRLGVGDPDLGQLALDVV